MESDLKYSRKMVLIPYNENHEKEVADVDTFFESGSEKLLRALDIRMRNVLQNKRINDQKKMFLHNQLMRQYLFIKKEIKKEKGEELRNLIDAVRKPHSLNTLSTRIDKSDIKPLKFSKRSHPLTLLQSAKYDDDDDDDNESDLDLTLKGLKLTRDGSKIQPNVNDDDDEDLLDFSTPTSALPDTSVSRSFLSSPPQTPTKRQSREKKTERPLPYNTRLPYRTRAWMRQHEGKNDDYEHDHDGQKGKGIRAWSYLK